LIWGARVLIFLSRGGQMICVFAIDEILRGCILSALRLLIEEKIAFGKFRGNELGTDDRR
jgi:hypothetical protein